MADNTIFNKPIKRQTMAEQMAETIQDSILAGELKSGAALPIEPNLAKQFGVSRAVVRDATRILMARGLVEVQHGRGVFVTQPDNDAFSDALLLALQRMGATAWDVESFEQILIPEIIALAAENSNAEDIRVIRREVDDYSRLLADYNKKWWGVNAPINENERLTNAYRQVLRAICEASGNKVIQQLALPLFNLRNLRQWADREGMTPQDGVDYEMAFVNRLIDAIETKDPDHARVVTAAMMTLPPEAIEAMRETPVGEISKIPVPLPELPTNKDDHPETGI